MLRLCYSNFDCIRVVPQSFIFDFVSFSKFIYVFFYFFIIILLFLFISTNFFVCLFNKCIFIFMCFYFYFIFFSSSIIFVIL